MKATPAAAAVPILLVLLTWLSFRATDPEAERYDLALKALDRFTMVEIGLQRDVLRARAGLLRNYDPLVQEVNSLREARGRLREHESGDAEEVTAIDRFAAAAARQEELTERFKTANALLQNSLAHFRLVSALLSASDGIRPLASPVSALTAAMLQLTFNTSPAAAHEVADRLNALAAQPFPAADADAVHVLLAHGAVLHDLLPTTDALLRALLATPSNRELKSLRTLIITRQAASRASSREFRLLLYIISLLLLAVLVHLGLRLRARARILRRRAAFERVIAGISTRLIDAQPHEIDAQIDHALAELAELVAADRAYLVVSGRLSRTHKWCREGIRFPPGWPDRASELAARRGVTPGGIIHIPNVDRLPAGADKDTLAAAGLRGWACISSPAECGSGIKILGFDALRPGIITQSAELGLLRMALDAVANVVVRDHLLQERARLETNLQHARRMETVGALASGVAHNFNNIVGAILGYSEMVEGQLAPESRAAHNLKEIRRAGERARDLVAQILAFGRRTEERRRPVDLRRLMDETKSLLDASLPSTIELIIREVPEEAVVSGHPGQVQQVILNLCNNAAQAMDQPGRITIDTELRQVIQARPLTHGELLPGRYACIGVSDSGCGMDEATLGRIFEPFFTTRVAGNGLGLATVREITREHGGAINVSSAPAVGTRFEVWLPCIGVIMPASPDDQPGLPLGRGETVLVIDEASGRLLADEEMLAAIGYEPVGFTRAADALAACRATPQRFDAIVVGHPAPISSSLDLAAALHEIAPDLPLLLATVSADEVGTDALVAAGVTEIVHRPLVSGEIAAALARCLPFPKIGSTGYNRNAFLDH